MEICFFVNFKYPQLKNKRDDLIFFKVLEVWFKWREPEGFSKLSELEDASYQLDLLCDYPEKSKEQFSCIIVTEGFAVYSLLSVVIIHRRKGIEQ